jgi:cardiolipin synthase
VVLAWQDLLPIWLAAAIIGRDIVIVVGAIAYRLARGRLQIKPTRLSKVNTFLEFAVLLLVMAIAAGWIDTGMWIRILFAIVFGTVLASGTQYVWRWGRKAMAQPRTR